MANQVLRGVAREELKKHMLNALKCYWPRGESRIATLNVKELAFPDITGPLRMSFVPLPDWAVDCGVNGHLGVPREACLNPDNPTVDTVDWWLAAFLMLECWHERVWELSRGVIHSYSLRLHGWDERVWARAWVNRIALFFRAWVAQESQTAQDTLFGPRPKAHLLMTHDVDAIAKTLPIRLKQGAFNLFNAGRAIVAGDFSRSKTCLVQAKRFLIGAENWWLLEELIEQERAAGIRSHFNFFADQRRKSFKQWLLDPDYKISNIRLLSFVKKISKEGWVIGLHPSFDAWQNTILIRDQKVNLEEAVGMAVVTCRQHWLRFSWGGTWLAQQEAGIELDTTLMFNDRRGFRAGAALQWQPWNSQSRSKHALQALPTVLMDSHLYDYQPMKDLERELAMARLVNEIFEVGGQAAVLWHPHTLTSDYGWQQGFNSLLNCMERIRS